MLSNGAGPRIIGEITIRLSENMVVSAEAKVADPAMFLMMLETAKMDLYPVLKKQKAERQGGVIQQAPPGFLNN